jgi:hypothetical protein
MASGRSWTIVEDLGCSNPSNRSQTIVRLVKQPLNNHVCETDVRTTLGLVDSAKQECYEALKAAELGAQGSPLLLSKLNEQHPAGNPYPDIVPLRRRSGSCSVEQFQASP